MSAEKCEPRRRGVLLLSLLIGLVLIGSPAAFAAEPHVVTLGVDAPDGRVPTTEQGREKLVEMTAERLRERMKAAAIKDFRVRVLDPSTVEVEAHVDHGSPWLVALLTAPGALEVVPVVDEGPDWLALASEMPEGFEIRGGADDVYVWSASRSALEKFFRRIAHRSGVLAVAPDASSGWRSLVLAATPRATHRELRSAKANITSRGTAFVDLVFGADLVGATSGDVQQSAIVLDGEVLAVLEPKQLEGRRIQLTAPRNIVATTRDQQKAWAHQISGRLAAPLPIRIAVLEE